jgi:hypothetical protein
MARVAVVLRGPTNKLPIWSKFKCEFIEIELKAIFLLRL